MVRVRVGLGFRVRVRIRVRVKLVLGLALGLRLVSGIVVWLVCVAILRRSCGAHTRRSCTRRSCV